MGNSETKYVKAQTKIDFLSLAYYLKPTKRPAETGRFCLLLVYTLDVTFFSPIILENPKNASTFVRKFRH